MKLIILILASDYGEYLKMQPLWKTYMNRFPYITSFFMKYKPDLSDNIQLQDDTIFIKGSDSFVPGCLDKTIKSIEFVLKEYDFDFIFRTNMSSVIDLQKLYNILNDKMKYAGVIVFDKGTYFASGAGFLLSKQMCQLLINNKDKLQYNIIDDVALGYFFTNNKIPITPLMRLDVYYYKYNMNLITKDRLSNHYHFRCKSDVKHLKTVQLMEKVIHLIYNTEYSTQAVYADNNQPRPDNNQPRRKFELCYTSH